MLNLSFIYSVLIGLFAGVFSGLFGIGGGIIIIPLLVYIHGFDQKAATGTSLTALLLPVGALGIWQYYKSGIIGRNEIVTGGLVAIGLFFGAYFGAKLAIHLSSKNLTRLFSIFLILVSARLWITAK